MNEISDPKTVTETLELAQSSVAQSATGADSIGRIETAHGNVFITHTDGSKVKGEAGLEIFQGDTVDTDATGSVGIVFADDSTFSLAEKGSMVIDSMIYDPGAQEGRSAFTVAEGVFTFVSGSIAKTGIDAMVINTPTATIGIRGTSLGGKVTDAKGTTVTLLPDGGAGKAGGDDAGDKSGLKGQQGNDGLGPAGEVVISNSVGTQTISQPYQTTQISSQFSSPTLPVILPASVVNQAYASAISVAPAPRGASAAPAGSSSSGNTGGGEQAAATGAEAAANPADGAGDGTPADAAAAAKGAATTAFNDAIAGGASLDDAMAAATTAAVETTVQAVLAANPEAFGTAASISSIVGAVVNAAMGGLGSSAGDPLDAGKGSDNAVSSQAAQAAAQSGTLAAIAGQAQAAAKAAVVTNAVALVQSGLMSQGALSELAANLNAGQPLGGALGAGLGGAINAVNFGAVFANVLATVVTVVAAKIDDAIAAITPAGETTVTTNVAGTESHDLVANQNDVFVGSAGNDTLSLFNAAQAGDTFDGGGGADTLSLATAGVGHVFRVSNTETVNLPSVGAGNTALLNIVGAGSTSISGSATGATAVAGDSSDQTLTFTNTFDGSTNNLSLTGGGGADKVTFANGTNVIAAMIGVESVELGSSSSTFNSPLSGVEFSSSAGTANITLAGVGNSISIASGEGIGTVTGSSGTDALTFTGFGSISSLSGFETVTAASASASFTLAAGGQSTTVSGTFGAITGGSGNDTVTFGSGGATISSLSGVETIVGGSGNDTVTLGSLQASGTIDLNGGTDSLTLANGANTLTVSDVELLTGGSGNDTLTITGAATGTIVGGGGADSISLSGASAAQTIVYNATGDYGDTVTGFTAGASGDVIKFNVPLSRGTNADFEALATGGTVGANTAVVNYTTNITTYTTAADVATALNTLSGLATANKMLFAVGNGTNTQLWHWQDGTGGTSDGTIDSGELTAVSHLTGVNNDSLTAANFSGYTGTDPLVFDLDGDGVELLGADAGVLFDVNGDGVGDIVGWAGPDDALLVSDLNGDGLITGMNEVVSPEFGPSAAAGASANSLDALALLDGNADGVIDAADDIFGTLQLWRDANTDGVTDTGELMSLGDLGIESISLAGGGVTIDAAGNTIWRTSSFTYDNGSTGEVAEISLARGGDRFVFESTEQSLSLSDFSGQTSFLGAVGDGDKLVLDASALGLSSVIYDEVVWDGSSTALNLSQNNANVVVLTGAAGSAAAAAAALAAGNGTASNATILFHDSANGSTLTMMHTDNLATDGGEATLATFEGITDTSAAETLASTDFDLQA